jgi:hypothetical protein
MGRVGTVGQAHLPERLKRQQGLRQSAMHPPAPGEAGKEGRINHA